MLTDSINFRLQDKSIRTTPATINVAGHSYGAQTAIIPVIGGSKNDTTQLKVKCYKLLTKKVAIVVVHEQNDDIQLVTMGGSTKHDTTRIVGWGKNKFLDTNPSGDDYIYYDIRHADSVIVAGANKICETNAVSRSKPSTDVPSRVLLETFLNEIYGQGVIQWTVDRTIYSKAINFDLNRDGKVNVYDFTNVEAKKISDSCRVAGQYSLFFVDNPSDGSNGMMDKGISYGFIHGNVTTTVYQTCAHELGHGAFSLSHPFHEFPSFPKGGKDTNNIMNYGSSRDRLRKYQWDKSNP